METETAIKLRDWCKKLAIIGAILVVVGTSIQLACADETHAVVQPRVDYSRYYCTNSLTIRFPWGYCRVNYSSRYGCYPPTLRGYACGTYVSCRRVTSRYYRCVW